MLFSTSNVYYENLILENPYSKFGTSWTIKSSYGWKMDRYKIVESYIKTNNKNIVDVLEMDEYELYLDLILTLHDFKKSDIVITIELDENKFPRNELVSKRWRCSKSRKQSIAVFFLGFS